MSKNLPISPHQLDKQAHALWAKLDHVQNDHETNLALKKSGKMQFWQNYEALLHTAKKNATYLQVSPKPIHTRRPSPPLHLTGVFMMNDHKLKQFKKKYLYARQLPDGVFKLLLALVLIYVNIPLGVGAFLSLVGFSICMIAFKVLVMSTSLENTIIEVQPDKIIRRGARLATAFIDLDKIQKIKESNLGLMVSQTGWRHNINYWLCENNFTSNSRVVYIPNVVESYDEIKVFLEEKLAWNQGAIT
ncbi:hypothetical protein [Microscilla marina]|uniref:Uncharacterized protein n=1 Tax=Microscilla marina ATCC 23134 TaxID=313606 RepID=A1ZUC8_MICM2|nr:hypothetical protein [Microscilla marina]EAY25947.1 hypothetical protein M23134_07092 [Microscilla marina ATCC 23134]